MNQSRVFELAATLAISTSVLLSSTAIASTDWSGFYVGVFTGVGSSDADWNGYDDDIDDAPVNISQELDDTGLVVGGYAGYNMQNGNLVYGVEIDAASFDTVKHVYLDGAEGLDLTTDTDAIGSVRGRFGYAHENYLFFASAGFAWIDASHIWDDGGSGDWDGAPVSIDSDSGWVVGGGIELATIEHVTIRAEGYYYDFGSTSGSINVAANETDTFNADHTASVFRLGFGYDF